MSYNAPNPASFNHLGLPAYTAPNPAAFNHTLEETLVVIPVTDESVTKLTEHYVQATEIGIPVTDESPISQHEKAASPEISIPVTDISTVLASNNIGGRIALIAYSDYAPFDGGNIELIATNGSYLYGRTPAITTVLDSEMSGAVLDVEVAPTVAIDSELSGAVLGVAVGTLTAPMSSVLRGALVDVEIAPTFVASSAMFHVYDGTLTFTAPTIVSGFTPRDALDVSLPFTEPAIAATFLYSPKFDAVLNFTAPRIDSRLLELSTFGVEMALPAATIAATASDQSGFRFTLEFTAPTVAASYDTYASSWVGELGFPIPTLEAYVPEHLWSVSMPFDTPEVSVSYGFLGDVICAFTAPAITSDFSSGFNTSFELPLPGLEIAASEPDSFSVTLVFDTPELNAGLSSHYNIEAVFDTPTIESSITFEAYAAELPFTVPTIVSKFTQVPEWNATLTLKSPTIVSASSDAGYFNAILTYNVGEITLTYSEVSAYDATIRFTQPDIAGEIGGTKDMSLPFAHTTIRATMGASGNISW